MSDKINDGGPAFPGEQGHIPDGTWNQTWESGMSLRDYFAAAALQGMLSHADDFRKFSPQSYAIDAYKYADAMLRAREVKP